MYERIHPTSKSKDVSAEKNRENTGAKKVGKILQKKVKPIVGVGSPESCVRSNLTRLKGG